jgi:hypothetical protein
VEAALAVIEARSQQRSEKKGQLELALQQAHYEAARAGGKVHDRWHPL